MNITEFYEIVTVPDIVFTQNDSFNNIYASRNFLLALEQTNHHIQYTYLVIGDILAPSAFAVIEILNVNIWKAATALPFKRLLAKERNLNFENAASKIAVVGHLYFSNTSGIYELILTDSKLIFQSIANHLKTSNRFKPCSTYFFKDYNFDTNQNESWNGFTAFQSQPDMIIPNINRWQTYEEYKINLKSKYRVKVNKANSLSSKLIQKKLDFLEIHNNSHDIQKLLDQVNLHSDFKTPTIDVHFYEKLSALFPEQIHVYGYFLDSKIVGFSSAIQTGKKLVAHFVGIEYALNKEYAIYQRMLNDYIQLAIAIKTETLHLGRTSSEIKSTVGAIAIPLKSYVSHKRAWGNLLFKPFVKKMKSTAFKQHDVFKH